MSRFPLPDPEPSASARWSTAAFAAELRDFVEAALGPVDLRLVKLRGWSTVWTARCAEGLFWAKQNCPAQAFEAALLDELGALVPGRVVPLRAVDRERGLLLTPDQGEVHASTTTDLDVWCTVVREWALLQREVAPYAERLGAAGVGTLLPQDCPPMLEERAAALHALPVDDPRRLDEEGLRRVAAGRDRIEAAVEEVAALGLAPALDHNDLHGGNVFVDGGGAGAPVRFFDLADALLTEPMAVLLTPLNVLRRTLGCAGDDPRLWRVAEQWVEVWSDLAPPRALRRALPDAMRLARLPRHEAWLRVTAALDAPELAQWGSAAAEQLVLSTQEPVLTG